MNRCIALLGKARYDKLISQLSCDYLITGKKVFSRFSGPEQFCRSFSDAIDINRIQKKVQEDLKKKGSTQQPPSTPPKKEPTKGEEEPGYFDMLNKLAASVKTTPHGDIKEVPTDKDDLAIRKRGDMKKKQEREKGQLTSPEIQSLLALHKSNPNEWTAQELAKKFGIELEVADSIVKNYALPSIEEIKPSR